MTTIQDDKNARKQILDYIEYLENTIMVYRVDATTGHIEEDEIFRRIDEVLYERKRRLSLSNNELFEDNEDLDII